MRWRSCGRGSMLACGVNVPTSRAVCGVFVVACGGGMMVVAWLSAQFGRSNADFVSERNTQSRNRYL